MKRVILVGLLAVLFIFPATGATGDGQTVITKPPARFGHSMVTVDNQVYVFGGEENSSGTLLGYFPNGPLFNDLWRLQEEQAKWEKQQASNPPPARKLHKTVVLDGKIYVFFGENSQGQPLGDVWEYNPGGNTWTQKETTAPAEARSQHSAVVINDRVYVFGGVDSNGEKLQDLWSYDPAAASNAWQQKASGPTSFRAHQAVIYNGEMYVHTFTQSLWCYKPGEDTWDYITPQNTIPARFYQTAVQTGDEMLVFGGQDVDGKEYRDAWAYNFVTNAWTERTTMPYSLTRAAGTLVTTTLGTSIQADAGPEVVIFGGLSNGVSGDRTLFFHPEGEGRWEIVGEMRVYLPLVMRNEQ